MCQLALLAFTVLPIGADSQEDSNTAQASARVDAGATSLRWGDFDGDGRQDLLVIDARGAAQVLHNRGDGGFDDVTASAGLEQQSALSDAAWVDVDADGRLDLFVLTARGEALVFRQQRGMPFENVSVALGLDRLTGVTSATWHDYDLDGRVDLQVQTPTTELLLHNTDQGLVEALRIERQGQVLSGPSSADLGEPTEPPLAVPVPGPPVKTRIGGGAPVYPATPALLCEPSIQDAAMPSNCIQASSMPTAGKLFPLGQRLFVDSGTGNVGIGTLTPAEKLDVSGGNIRTDAQLISTASMGPPLAVSSSAKVVGLNADQLDGFDSSSFSQLGTSIETAELANGAVTSAKLANGAVTNAKLGSGAVTSEKISPAAVGASQLGPLALNNSHVAAMAAIDGSKIAPNFVENVTSLGAIGAGVATPLATVHAVGTPSLGSIWVCPAETGSGADSELLLAEDDNGTFGVKLRYNATANQLEIRGRADDADSAQPTVVVERDSGKMSIGNNGSQLGQLTVNGSADTGLYAVEVLGGAGPGVHVTTTSTSDAAILAVSLGAGMPAIDGRSAFRGVFGETTAAAAAGAGVYGIASPTTGSSVGVAGIGNSSSGTGVLGQTMASSGINYGVSGSSSSSSGRGVAGFAFSGSGLNYGVRGFTASAAGFGVYASGDLGASGVKSFLQPHPQDPSKEIRFICLEGNEAGTYFRGSSQLSGGRAIVQVPEEFRLVSEQDGVTVQLTPRGPGALWVEAQDAEQILVAGTGDVEFDYLVNGVRRGFQDIPLVRENSSFVPTEIGVPFGTQYPEGLREVLVGNGILNADGTPNEATAASMGWPLRVPASASDARYR